MLIAHIYAFISMGLLASTKLVPPNDYFRSTVPDGQNCLTHALKIDLAIILWHLLP